MDFRVKSTLLMKDYKRPIATLPLPIFARAAPLTLRDPLSVDLNVSCSLSCLLFSLPGKHLPLSAFP